MAPIKIPGWFGLVIALAFAVWLVAELTCRM